MQSTSEGVSKIVLERVHTSFQYDLNVLILLHEAEFLSSDESQ